MGFLHFRGKVTDGAAVQAVSSAHDGENGENGENGEAHGHIRKLQDQHRFDPFMDMDQLNTIDGAVGSGDAEKEAAAETSLMLEDSPYAEVRASVSPTDVPDEVVDSIRAWTIGLLTCTGVAAMNLLLGQHYTSVTISSSVVQLISYPMGTGWARYMPARTFRLLGREVQLNPGPFNKKEHTLITMMTAAGAASSYAFDILLAQQVYYKQSWGWLFQILLTISTQAMGLGIAGMLRRFLVWPAAMVWPVCLITTAVMATLHDHSPSDPSTTNGWRIGRYMFFLAVSAATFVWQWLPSCIAPFLSYLGNFPCWIAPNNVAVNQVFGGHSGIGLLPLTLDWAMVAGWFGSPLQFPAFAMLNLGAGGLLFLLVALCIAYGGPDFNRYLPLVSNANYDRFGKHYNVSSIITPDVQLNLDAYHAYSPLFLGPAFSLSYAMSFAALMSNVVHVSLFYGRDIVRRLRDANYEEPDVHLKLMRRYRESPEWWYAVVFGASFVFGIIAALCWETHLTWWAYLICIGIGAVLVLPVGVIQAITNQQTGLNVITELIVGYMLPGRPVAMMMFKSWGYMLCFNALTYVSDMKTGHYMKVPPRSLFRAQLFAVLWLSIVQVATYNWMMGNLPDICTPHQAQGFTCQGAKTFFNASVIWGLIGPRRLFGIGVGMFAWTNWFWLIGALCPAIQWLVARRYPRSVARYIFFPAVFGVASMIPPATIFALLCWLLVGLVFNVYIRHRYNGWWSRYNYVLSGALDIGNALQLIVFALALGLSRATFPSWWGSTVVDSTADGSYTAVSKVLPDGQSYGPASWE